MVEDVKPDADDTMMKVLQSGHVKKGAPLLLKKIKTWFNTTSAGFYLFFPDKVELLCFEGEKPSGALALKVYRNSLKNILTDAAKGFCAVFPLCDGEPYGVIELFWENPPSKKERERAEHFYAKYSVVMGFLRRLTYVQEKMLQHHAFLNNILESLHYPFYVVDVTSYTVKIANSAAFLGTLPENTRCYTLIHKKKHPCNGLCPIKEMKRTQNPVKVEHIHHDKGDKRTVEVYAYPLFDSNGNITQAIEYCLDITERKKAEEELIRLSAAVKMSHDSIIITDTKGTIIDINEAALSLYGAHQKKELCGKNVMRIVAPEDVKKVQSITEEVLTKGAVKKVEHDILLKDNVRITVETNITMMKDAKGIPMGTIIIIRDITERKKAEKQKKRRLMKFNLKEGNVYLVKEPVSGLSRKAFEDLLKVGYPGFIISRTPKKKCLKIMDKAEYVWVAEHGSAVPPDLEGIKTLIRGLPKSTAVLIDRLDYVISKNRFSDILFFVQHVTEIAYIKDHVVIVSVDPSTLKERELRQLEKETEEIELLRRKNLSEDLLEVLTFVYNQNISGIKPSYTEIRKKIGVSKPTARKRIKALINCGYVAESKKGRTKVVEITERAKLWF